MPVRTYLSQYLVKRSTAQSALSVLLLIFLVILYNTVDDININSRCWRSMIIVCMLVLYVCEVVTFGRLRNKRYYMVVANSTCGQLKRENRPCLRKWFRDERGSAVQSCVSPFHSPHSDREEPASFRDGVHLCHQPPSGQSRFYRVTQLRTDTPVLSTGPLHTNSGCGKERRILIAPW